MTRLAVTGATGHMGRAVRRVAEERGHEVVPVSRSGEPWEGWSPGLEFEDEEVATVRDDDLSGVLASEGADVLVDFTVPESSVAYAEASRDAGTPVVTGTTGFDEEQLATLRDAATEIPVLKAANFARGVQALLRAVRAAVGALPGYDVEVTETHHNRKRDAPSGTAKTVLTEIEEGRPDLDSRVYGREGVQPRDPGEVGVHVRRAGGVHGEHEVMLAGNDEVVTLAHRAESRGVFAAGALDAADWLRGRDPGLYGFEDVLDADERGETHRGDTQ